MPIKINNICLLIESKKILINLGFRKTNNENVFSISRKTKMQSINYEFIKS